MYYRDTDFLEKPDISINEVFYNNLYPYNFIPQEEDNSTNAKTYVTFNTARIRPVKGDKFRSSSLVIRVFTHRDLFRTDYGALRVDYLVSEIDELMSNSRGIGIGKLEFDGIDEFYVNNSYTGYLMIYRPVDFSDKK
jgi:hypothetical protein